MSETKVRAIVRVVMEVDSNSVWSGSTTWDQISKQAEDAVRGLLTGGNELALKDLQWLIKSLKFVGVKIIREGDS